MFPLRIRDLLIVSFAFLLAGTSLGCEKLNREIIYTRARSLHDNGKYEKAIELYKKLISSSSDNSEVQYDLGVAYADMGDMESVRKQIKILKEAGRTDLAQILETIAHDADRTRVRKKLQSDYNENNND